jgi:hypothetical protein
VGQCFGKPEQSQEEARHGDHTRGRRDDRDDRSRHGDHTRGRRDDRDDRSRHGDHTRGRRDDYTRGRRDDRADPVGSLSRYLPGNPDIGSRQIADLPPPVDITASEWGEQRTDWELDAAEARANIAGYDTLVERRDDPRIPVNRQVLDARRVEAKRKLLAAREAGAQVAHRSGRGGPAGYSR